MQKRKKVVILSLLSMLSIGGGVLIGLNSEGGFLKALGLDNNCTHKKVNHYEGSFPTDKNIGKNQPYWICCECNKNFKDENCTTEIVGTGDWNGLDLALTTPEQIVEDTSGREGNILDFLNAKIDGSYTDGINGGTNHGKNNYEYVDIDDRFAFKFSTRNASYSGDNKWAEIRFAADNVITATFEYKLNDKTVNMKGSDGIDGVHTFLQFKEASQYYPVEMNLIPDNRWHSVTLECPTECMGSTDPFISTLINIKLCKFIGDLYISNLEYTKGVTTYEWSNDNSSCKATYQEKGSVDVVEEVLTTSSTQDPTYLADGKITYTAEFDSDVFTTQVKEVKIDQLWYTITDSPIEHKGVGKTDEVEPPTGYQLVNKYAGKWASTPNSIFSYVDLRQFKEFKFSVLLDGSSSNYFEVFVGNSTSKKAFDTNKIGWTEFDFVDEGNGYFQMYKDGAWANFKMQLDDNLNSLYIVMGNHNVYITEIIGKVRTSITTPYKKITNNSAIGAFNNGTLLDNDKFDLGYGTGYSNAYNKTVKYAKETLFALDLKPYKEIMFAFKGLDDGNVDWVYFNIPDKDKAIAETEVRNYWTIVKLVRQDNNSWILSMGNLSCVINNLTNLNQITSKVAAGTYNYSPLYAVELEEYSNWKVVQNTIMDRSNKTNFQGWDTYDSDVYEAPKNGLSTSYTYTQNSVSTSAGLTFNLLSVDLSNYSRIMFYLRSANGGYCYVYNNGVKMFDCELSKQWQRLEMINNLDGTWNYSYGRKAGTITIDDLASMSIKTTWANHWFGTLYGVEL